MATPGSILITEYTRKLTEGYFELKALGAAEIKGVEEPLNVYEVLGAGPLRTRLQVAARRGLTRFVGRQSELEQMQRAVQQAKAGHGQIVGVMGEPGVGKSRLFHEFVGAHSRAPLLVLQAYSVSHGKASPYLPVIELLKTYFQMQPQDEERTRREKVLGKVLGLDRSLEDTLPYLFALLGLEDSTSSLHQMDPQIRRRRTFEVLKRLFLRESLNQPLILIFEDLHWIDTETQGFLDVLSESVASARILLLTNYRPEYRHEWGAKTYYTQLRLAPFGKDEAEEFVMALLDEKGSPLPARERDRVRVNTDALQQLKHLILDKTEGTPFFMEEVVQELFEQGILVRDAVGAQLRPGFSSIGHAPLPIALHIPTTVQGVLAARIDRLSTEEKALLQQLAVIGREFPLSLARQVVSQSEEELYRLLSLLQGKEFVYEQPAFPEVEYIFKHALTQEVAYNSLLIEGRKVLHEQTAQAIEALYSASLEDHYSELAHHCSRSGNTQKAVKYLQLAGQQAAQRSANAEAITHLTIALELLKTLPDTPERAQQELTLQITLGTPLKATKGYAAPEVEKTYTRAWELCQQLWETPQLVQVLRGLAELHYVLAEFQTAYELGAQLLSLAQNGQDPTLLLEAHRALGALLSQLGEFGRARAYMEQGLALYDSHRHHPHTFRYGQDLGVSLWSHTARVLWLLGYPDQARKRSHEALALAQELSHPFSLAFALVWAARLHHFCREGQAVQERAEAAVALSTEQGFSLSLAHGTLLWGWALAEQGQGEEGIAQMRHGLAAFRATGAEGGRPYWLALLAEAYGKGGQVKEGLTALAEALDAVDRTEERMYEAELYRLKGQLTLQKFQVSGSKFQVENSLESSVQSLESEAEECFLKAIEIARKQQAKSLELRAVMSLSRLWQQQGKKAEARQMLAEIYGWFTEGFDTKDLQEAKALLEELKRETH
jgi:predicted ATPase